ncbi:MAG: T9SS type A sorting domain-containing protein [Bacteroidetes bacterium]|nr:T9SS type A sorting domain-containing protein [Bacteroidota bacterium]MCL2303405.1 T9SS type A sorting domain-containing protein [Lentimicrobiaceae bacterium]
MKKLLLSIVSAFLLFTLSAQVSENFSDYNVGGKIAQQAHEKGREYWTTWDLNPGGGQDGIVAEMPAGNKCLRATLVSSSSFDDNVLRLGDKVGTVWNPKTTGIWELTFKIYIPAGKDGYFNIKSVFPSTASPTWALQVYMGTTEGPGGGAPGTPTPGVGVIFGGSTDGTSFNFAHDTWVPIKIHINLDDDICEMYVNDNMVHTYQYSKGSFGESDHRFIAAFNIYPPNTAATSLFYIDDIDFYQVINSTVLFETSFDDVPLGAPVALSYPGWWTTWTNNPGGADDGVISNEQASSQPQSAKVSWNDDIVFKAGDLTTGTYTFDFEMYIPNNSPAYFNLLHHFAIPNPQNSKWALGVYFNITQGPPNFPATGTYVRHNDQRTNFTAPNNTWFPVSISIDLDNDLANISINGTEILEWKFSIEESGAPGQRQLAAISYWPPQAGSSFYIDNFVFSSTVIGETFPIMNVTPNKMDEFAAPGSTQTKTNPITVTNTGTSMGDYNSWIEFDFDPPTGTNNYTITYSSDYEGGGVGYGNNATPLIEVAAKYPTSVYCDKMGTYITKVAYFMYQPVTNNTLTARVYGSGSYNSPGEVLAQATITNAMSGNWNEITLSTPVLLDGQDIWVAFEFTQPVGGFPISYDEGDAIENSNWTRSDGGGWRQMFTVSNPPQPIGRYMIKAFTQGGVVPGCWLSLTGDTYGNVPKGTNKTFNAVFNPTGLAKGTYKATIYVTTNDAANPLFTIPCTFIIDDVGIGEHKIKTLIYPNPANDKVNIESNVSINSIQIFNNMGQMVHTSHVNAAKTTVNTLNFATGLYFIKVNTDIGTQSIKFMVK